MPEQLSAELDLDYGAAIAGADALASAIEESMQQGAAAGASAIADALDGLTASAVEVPVEADVSTAQGEIDGLSAAPVEVPVDADVAGAEGEIHGITADPITVDVEADTSNADVEISSLGDTASGASESLSGLGEAGQHASGGMSEASVAAGAAGGAIAGVGGTAVGAAAGIAGVGLSFKELFDAGVVASTGVERLKQAAGDLADQIQHVQVGNLNTSLSELGHQFGSTGAEMDSAAAKAFQFATAGGFSAQKSAQFADGIDALAARAVALNPSLGNVADVADQMSTSFGRVLLAAKKYNLALSSTEVAQQAMADTGKTATNQLTVQEKAVAAVEVATAKYGDTLAQKIAEGADLAANKQKSLIATAKDLAETLGRPLAEVAINSLSALQGPVEGALRFFKALPGPVQEATVALLAFGVAGKLLGGSLQAASGFVGRLAFGLVGAEGGFAAVLPAIGAVGLGVGVLGVASGNTTESILGMTAAGAAFGTMIEPGLGTAIGAGIGALVGFAASLHGASDQADAVQVATQNLNKAVTSGSIPAIIIATDAVQRATASHGAFAEALDRADRSTGLFSTHLAPKLSQSYEAVKIEGEAFQHALEKSPAAALTTVAAYDKLGISTELYKDKLTASVRSTELAQQAQAQLGAAATPLKVTFEQASTAVGGLTERQFEVAGAASQALDSMSKLDDTNTKFVESVKAGNASQIEAAANANATAIAQDKYNQVLLATGSATEAAKQSSSAFHDTLANLLTSIPPDNPAHQAIQQILDEMDNLTAHPATIDLKVDGGSAALQLASINRAIDDIIKHPKENPVKIFLDDTEATSKLDGIRQARDILVKDPSKFQVVMEDLATGKLDALNALELEVTAAKKVDITAQVQGTDDVAELKKHIEELNPKTVDAIANAIGAPDVEALKSTIGQLTPKQVDAVAQAIGKGDVDALAGAVLGLNGKQVAAIANAFGEPAVRSLVGAVEGLSPKQVEAIANAIGKGDVEALNGAVQGLSPKTVEAIAHALGLPDVQALAGAIASVQSKEVLVKATVSGAEEAQRLARSLGAASGMTVPYGGGYASGGNLSLITVGERGEELALLPGGTRIFNNGETRAIKQREGKDSGASAVAIDTSSLDASADRLIAAAELLIAVTGIGPAPSRRLLEARR